MISCAWFRTRKGKLIDESRVHVLERALPVQDLVIIEEPERLLLEIEADVFLLVDSDDTYDASVAPELIKLLLEQSLDMVNGVRISEVQQAYWRGHRLGNRVLTGLVPRLPTALLAAAFAILRFLSFTCGFILDTVSRGRAEFKRLAYLSVPVRFTSVKSIDPLGTER
jgi:hypothetical protein